MTSGRAGAGDFLAQFVSAKSLNRATSPVASAIRCSLKAWAIDELGGIAPGRGYFWHRSRPG